MEVDATCCLCGKAINRHSRKACQGVIAWERGDKSELVIVEWLDEYACARCVAEGELAAAPDPAPDLPSSAL
jgi:hypothetical protein